MNPEGYGYFIAPRGKGAPILVELLPGTGGGGGPPASQLVAAIVFRPGAASSGFFVETWPEVQAVMAASPAGVVFVDDGTVSPALVPGATGITDFQGRWELRPYRPNFQAAYSELTVQDGATLKAVYKISGTLQVNLDPGASGVHALDFDYAPNVLGVCNPGMYLEDGAYLAMTLTATIAGCKLPAIGVGGEIYIYVQSHAGFISGTPGVPLFDVSAGAIVNVNMREAALLNSSFLTPIDPSWCLGAGGACNQTFNSDSVTLSGGIVATSAPTNGLIEIDSHLVTLDFLASTPNVLAALQSAGQLPAIGLLAIQYFGFGGSGGGGGGSAGSAFGPGAGGGGSGGCIYQTGSFTFQLANQLDVVLGTGGTAGAAGIAAGGAGGDGGDGNPSSIQDATAGNVLVLLQGSTGGQGGTTGGPAGDGGCSFSNTSGASIGRNRLANNTGFEGAGGAGGAASQPGSDGNFAALSLGFGATGFPNTSGYLGGAGGASAPGQGAGGGGGGQGPYQAGQNGGASSATVGGDGVPPAPNAGAGAGGGAGGTGAADNGGAGAVGALGRMRLQFIAPG